MKNESINQKEGILALKEETELKLNLWIEIEKDYSERYELKTSHDRTYANAVIHTLTHTLERLEELLRK